MIDNEVIKCAELCLQDVPNCPACPFNDEHDCADKLLRLCFDLIKRQKTEIRELNNQLLMVDLHYEDKTKQAVKEFATKYNEWEKAEEEGRMIILPLPLGSPVYHLQLARLFSRNGKVVKKIRKVIFNEYRFFAVLKGFGKIYFKTKEEAKEAAKRITDNDE